MRKLLPAIVVLFAVASFGCERSFDAPPDEVRIESFDPASGFADDRMVICGRNLGAGDSATTVRFGTTLAERADDDPGLAKDCTLERLAVLVPELSDPEMVDLVVASEAGQATAEETFDYRGPGHPPEDIVSGVVRIRSRPQSLAARRIPVGDDAIDVMVAACMDSSLIQLIESSQAVSFGFGTVDQPIAAEMALDGIEVIDEQLVINFSVLTILIAVSQQDGLSVEPRLERKAARFILDDQGERLDLEAGQLIDLPIPPPQLEGAQFPALPWRLWSACRQPDCGSLDIVVSHAAAPILWVLPSGRADGGLAVGASEPLGLDDRPCHPLGQAVDVALVPGADHLTAYTSFVEDSGELGGGLWTVDLAEGSLALRAGPADPISGEAQCGLAISSLATSRLAVDRADLRVYAADGETAILYEFAWADTALGERLVGTGRFVPLPAATIDLATGRFARLDADSGLVAAEHLYAATRDGIFIIDISAQAIDQPLEVIERIDIGPDVLATTISFGLIDAFVPVGAGGLPEGADSVFFADGGGDRWYGFDAGLEQFTVHSQPIVTSLPQVATSRLMDGFYLADASVDALRVVERRSGVQCLQVPIEGKSGFSQGYMATTHAEDRDVVMVALPSEMALPNPLGFSEFDRIVAITFEPGPAGGCDLEADRSPPVAVEPFHQMILLNDEQDYFLLFYHFGDGVAEGSFRHCLLDLERPADQMLAQMACSRGTLLAGLLTMRLSPRHQIAAYMFYKLGGVAILVEDPESEGSVELGYQINGQALGFFTDFIAVRLGSESEPAYLLAIPLGTLGQVQLVAFTSDGNGGYETKERLLPTGGIPEKVYTSPDERQLYFVNLSEGLITVVDLDCEDLPACIVVEQTLEVDELPYGVTFSASGDVGYVTHLFGSVISVIE